MEAGERQCCALRLPRHRQGSCYSHQKLHWRPATIRVLDLSFPPTTRLGNAVVPQASCRHWPRRLRSVRRLVVSSTVAGVRIAVTRFVALSVSQSELPITATGDRDFLFGFPSLGSASSPFADNCLIPWPGFQGSAWARADSSILPAKQYHRARCRRQGPSRTEPLPFCLRRLARHVSQHIIAHISSSHHSARGGRDGVPQSPPPPLFRPAFGPSLARSLSCDYAFWRRALLLGFSSLLRTKQYVAE
jgi:hypothetical protein